MIDPHVAKLRRGGIREFAGRRMLGRPFGRLAGAERRQRGKDQQAVDGGGCGLLGQIDNPPSTAITEPVT
jgi:hypothetical protein